MKTLTSRLLLAALMVTVTVPAFAGPDGREWRGRGDGPHWRDDGRRGDRHHDRRDWKDDRRGWKGGHHWKDDRRAYRGRGGPPVVVNVYPAPRRWSRGDRLPPYYREPRYVVRDWRGHRLPPPRRGYHWVGVGAEYFLVGVATGIVLESVINR